MCRLLAAVIKALAIVVALAGPAAAAPCVETAKTVAGVQCVEDDWSRAFIGGDAAYLTALLADDYRSYRPDGKARDRAAIIDAAHEHAKAHPNEVYTRPKVPPDIQVRGDIAVVFFKNTDGALVEVDAFTWSAGRWHAWYSQHTEASD